MTVLKNYKYLFLPILLYEIFTSLIINCFDFCFSTNYPTFLLILFISLLISIEFVLLPTIVVIYFRIGICILNNKNFHKTDIISFLTRNNLLKIILVSFIPNLVDISYSLFKCYKAQMNSSIFYFIINFLLLIITYYTEYKFFICNYELALMRYTPKDILCFSFSTMKHKLLNYIKYDISFIFWDLIIIIGGIVGVSVLNLINIEVMHFEILISSAFGIMFFYRPYRFFSNLLYSEHLIKNMAIQRIIETKDGSVC